MVYGVPLTGPFLIFCSLEMCNFMFSRKKYELILQGLKEGVWKTIITRTTNC